MIKQPCTQDCPNRNAECHAHCEKWALYEAERNARYIEDGRARDIQGFLYKMESRRKKNIATGRMSLRKPKKYK